MSKAKDIILRPIAAGEANDLVRRVHYSGKVVQNSQVHIGVFLHGKLEGAMQFGPSLDKRKIQGLVSGTLWHEFIELNRMAFSDALPRNSESRAIAIAMKLLRKHAPQLKWVVSFADATQCGDGAIYRASGFVLTGIKENQQLYTLPFAHELEVARLLSEGWSNDDIEWTRRWLTKITPPPQKIGDAQPPVAHRMAMQSDGAIGARRDVAHKLTVEDRPATCAQPPVAHKISLQGHPAAHKMSLEGGQRPSLELSHVKRIMRRLTNGGTSADVFFRAIGGEVTTGYQLRYIYFLDPSYRARLTVPEVPFSEIERIGAGMYKGVKRAGEVTGVTTGDQPGEGQFDSDPPALECGTPEH